MISILVTGSNGQMGSALCKAAQKYNDFAFTYVDIAELDLTDEPDITQYFKHHRFNYIINCAAYTAVDLAEKQDSMAYAVNAKVPSLLGEICSTTHTRLIHISTDYVYDGSKSIPHIETDELLAQSVYAKSKLEGERALWQNANAMIIRTSWLYGEFGNNFMKTMIRLSKEKEEIRVVYDQTGTPTYSGDLAIALLDIIRISEESGFAPGVYNYANEGVCSWYDFAVEIMRYTKSACTIRPVRTSEYPLPAKRPEYSVMDKQKIRTTFKLQIPYWKDSMMNALANLRQT